MDFFRRLPTNQKVLLGTVVLAVGYFGYRYYENKKAASASSTTATQTQATTGEGTSTGGPTTGGMGYFGGGGPTTGGGGGGTGGTPGPTGPAGPAGKTGVAGPPGKAGSAAVGGTAPGGASNPLGLEEQTIAGKKMVELGVTTGPSRYTGYSIAGAAPVYFYIPKSAPGGGRIVTGLTPAQVAALPAGTGLFTPTSYYSQISKTQKVNQGFK